MKVYRTSKLNGIFLYVLGILPKHIWSMETQPDRIATNTEEDGVLPNRLSHCSAPSLNIGKASSRVQRLLASLTLEEKVGQMTQINTGEMTDLQTKRLNTSAVDYYVRQRKVGSFLNTLYEKLEGPPPTPEVWVESINLLQREYQLKTRARIPMMFGIDSVHGANYIYGATLFPQQLGLASTFNRNLAQKSAEVTAKDTRAVGIHWNFSPILDIAVNKQWPRVYETFGEDPYLVAELGAATILGYQGCHQLHEPTRVAATMKHFIGYSNSRSGHDVDGGWMGDRILKDYFVPPFLRAVRNGVATAMESYSDINGDHLVNSKHYLVDLLRHDLEFKGLLVTDWEQINKLHKPIHIAPTIRDAVRRVIKLGSLDMSMVPNNAEFIDHVMSLVADGTISMDIIDQSVLRILDLKEKLGLLDHHGMIDPNSALVKSIGSAEDRLVSLEAARESIILLKNNDQTLPLTSSQSVLVLGPTSDSLTYLTGGWTYSWQGPSSESLFLNKGTTILQGIRNQTKAKVTHLPGVDIEGHPLTPLPEVIHQAQLHDVIVVCLGERHYAEFKGNIPDMNLPKGQVELLHQLQLQVPNKKIVLVLSEGRPRVIQPIDKVGSVLLSLLVGPQGGQAIGEILYGVTNPSGKLPITYANQPNLNNLNYYHRFNEDFNNVQWEFGHGLSYTTFNYTNLTLSARVMTPHSSPLLVSVTVTNTGSRSGLETVLLFLTDEFRSISPEVKLLKGFEKVNLMPHASHTIHFGLTFNDMAFHDEEMRRVVEAGKFVVRVGPLQDSFDVVLPNGSDRLAVP